MNTISSAANAATQPPSGTSSISEAKEQLLFNSQTQRERMENVRAIERTILERFGDARIRAAALTDPKLARDLATELAGLQGELTVAKIIAESSDDRLTDLGPIVIEDTGRLIGEVQRASAALVARVRANCMARLRETKLFEEARLPRLVEEANPFRRECAWHARFGGLGIGGADSRNDGQGGVYYERMNAGAIVSAHNAAEKALAELTARAGEIAKTLG